MTSARILIVEDEFLVATNIEAVLEDLGYRTVGIAPDMSTAMALVVDDAPDLALVDVNLRDGRTGPIIAEALRERGVGVVFVTANPRMIEDASHGAIGVLTKPCDDETIGAAVSYALYARRGVPLMSPPAGLTLLQSAA